MGGGRADVAGAYDGDFRSRPACQCFPSTVSVFAQSVRIFTVSVTLRMRSDNIATGGILCLGPTASGRKGGRLHAMESFTQRYGHARARGSRADRVDHGHRQRIGSGSESDDLLAMAADFIDFIKFGFGTSVLYRARVLARKLGHCSAPGVACTPAVRCWKSPVLSRQGPGFFRWCRRRLSFVEVSDGTIDCRRPYGGNLSTGPGTRVRGP